MASRYDIEDSENVRDSLDSGISDKLSPGRSKGTNTEKKRALN
jgi:hypothetical protein